MEVSGNIEGFLREVMDNAIYTCTIGNNTIDVKIKEQNDIFIVCDLAGKELFRVIKEEK